MTPGANMRAPFVSRRTTRQFKQEESRRERRSVRSCQARRATHLKDPPGRPPGNRLVIPELLTAFQTTPTTNAVGAGNKTVTMCLSIGKQALIHLAPSSNLLMESDAKSCDQTAGSIPVIVQPLAIGEIQRWIIASGLAGGSEADFLHDFCTKCRQAGLSLSQAIVIIDTLHPTYEGRAFRWQATPTNESRLIEYGPPRKAKPPTNGGGRSFFTCCKPVPTNSDRASIPSSHTILKCSRPCARADTPISSPTSIASTRTGRSARWTRSTPTGPPTRQRLQRGKPAGPARARAFGRARDQVHVARPRGGHAG